MTAPVQLAVVLSSGEVERLYSGLSMLVSAATDGTRCAALATFRALDLLLDPDLGRRAQEPAETPALSWAGRETFGRSLLELRDTALDIEGLALFACAASVDTMEITRAEAEDRLDGVRSTPRFLRETDGARLLFV